MSLKVQTNLNDKAPRNNDHKWKLREQSFDNPSTREGYSKKSIYRFVRAV
jgi:hypothetical protein